MRHFFQLAIEFVVGLNNFLRIVAEYFSLACQPELFFGSISEPGFKLAFHEMKLLANGGLSQAVSLRRHGEAFSFSQIQEDFQMFNPHSY